MKISKQRLEAFTDGIIAIIITIMVLSVPLPASFEASELWGFLTSILIYLLSFIVVGAFWNQHSRLFSLFEKVDHKIVAANFFFLLFLSLIPLFTKWVIENPGTLLPVIGYDVVYMLVSWCYMLIFRLVMNESQHEEVEHIKKIVEMRRGIPRGAWAPFLLIVVLIAGVVVMSIFLPLVSTYILMGIPVLSSLINIFSEGNGFKHR